MKIIDFEKRGNVVRFYLGESNCDDYTGDGWNDASYKSNAGRVYDKYIAGYHDIVFPFDFIVREPADDVRGSRWCKNDMKEGNVACIAVLRAPENNQLFDDVVIDEQAAQYFFGDIMSPSTEIEIFGEQR